MKTAIMVLMFVAVCGCSRYEPVEQLVDQAHLDQIGIKQTPSTVWVTNSVGTIDRDGEIIYVFLGWRDDGTVVWMGVKK